MKTFAQIVSPDLTELDLNMASRIVVRLPRSCHDLAMASITSKENVMLQVSSIEGGTFSNDLLELQGTQVCGLIMPRIQIRIAS